MIWRLVTSSVVHVTLSELKDGWDIDDLMQAHDVLDTLEAMKQDGDS